MDRFTRMQLSTADAGRSLRGRRGSSAPLARAVALAAVLLGMLGSVPTAASAAATSPEFFGTNFSTLSAIPSSKWPVTLNELRQSRMTVNRFDVRWDVVEPSGNRNGPGRGLTDPGYRFKTAYDPLIALMAQHGLRGSPSFRFEPAWARSAASHLPPESYDDYGRMIAAFAKRYGPGGDFWKERPDLTPQPVYTYELWNEVNLGEYAWDANPSAAAYGAMAKVVRPIIKAALPSAIILGSLSWKDRVEEAEGDKIDPFFISKLAASGALSAFDGMGYHPYAPEAQSTIDLVIRLRQQLVAHGQPNMPIYADEAGQEAITYDPTTGQTAPNDKSPATFAHQLFPTDAARGANLAYAGEALAASDCGVAQFLPYGVSGPFSANAGANNLPRTEAWMGLYFNSSGLPTLSAQALQRASARWAARFDAGGPGAPASLALCNPGVSPAASMLPIDAAFTGTATGCAAVEAKYDGNPLESAYLRFFDVRTGAQLAEARTNAFGRAEQCIPEEMRGQPFRLLVNVGQTGQSGIVDCDVWGVGCYPGVTITPGRGTASARVQAGFGPPTPAPAAAAEPAAPKPTAPAKCKWALRLTPGSFTRQDGNVRGRKRLNARVSCQSAPVGTKVRFVMSRVPAKGGRARKVGVVRLTVGKSRMVGVGGMRRGERLVLLHRAEPTIGIPRLRASLVVGAKPSSKSKSKAKAKAKSKSKSGTSKDNAKSKGAAKS